MATVLLELRSIPGGWRLALGRPDSRAVDRDLTAERLDHLRGEIDRVLDVHQGLLASDAEVSTAERKAGALLGSLLEDAEFQAVLHGALGEARGRGEQAVLVVDAVGAARALPWELLGAEEGLEASGQAIIVRRTTGAQRDVPVGLSVALHLLEPEDPLSSRRAERLREQFATQGIHVTDAPDASPTVLHVIGHGDRDLDQTLFATAAGLLGVSTPVHALIPALANGPLVVLDVCDAGSTIPEEASSAPRRLLAAGASAVVAPLDRLSIDAAEAFAHGFYPSLARGDHLAAAMAEGRRGIRAIAHPHADGRWSNLTLTVSGVPAALHSLEQPGFVPEGWDVRGPARAWVVEAAERAIASGFFGLEHLLECWPDLGSPIVSHVRFHVAHQGGPLGRLASLQPRGSLPPEPDLSPRLRAFRPAAVDTDALAQQLWDNLDGALQALLAMEGVRPDGLQTVSTLEPGALPAKEHQPAGSLEVLGGPEDGRQVESVRVGRAEVLGGPGLYGHCTVVDPYLSRRVLERTSGGWRAHKPLRVRRAGRFLDLPVGDVDLFVGDVVWLSRATSLRGRP